MSTETIVLLSNALNDSQPTTWQYSDKKKGAGYHKHNDGLHTVVFQLDNFKGSIKLQGTLELYPGNSDWVDITFNSGSDSVTSLDSTPLVSLASATFTGRFVWIRAAYQLEEGTITEIRYNC